MNGVKYIAPDGKVYIGYGLAAEDFPEFAQSEGGQLKYRYRSWQEVHDVEVDDDGYLLIDGTKVKVDNDGNVQSDVTWVQYEDEGATAQTQKAINAIRSHNKVVKLRATLLDENYAVIDSLEGKIAGSPSYEMDADSNIRRTCAITLSIPKKENIAYDFENTWNKRVVELSCGLYSWEDNDYIWFDLGRMLMTSGSTVYDAMTQEVKLNLVDLMANITDDRGSQMGTSLMFYAGTNVQSALIGIITTFSQYKRYNVCEFEDTIPYDVTTDIGDYPIDAITTILDLFPYHEYFYDSTGTFVIRQIPTKISDPIDFHKELLDDLIISESREVDFSEVKNTTEIWGRSLTADYTAISCTTVGTCYKVYIDDTFTELVQGEKYAIYPTTDSVAGQTMQIQDTLECQIYTANGSGTTYTPIEAGAIKAATVYVLRYYDNKFILEGELNIRAIVQEITEEPSAQAKEAYKTENNCNNVKWVVNPDSPFACTIQNGIITGEIKQVLEGGEYDAIYTTSLAYERANYETWLKCRRQDTVEIEMVLIPWMEINDKIEFTMPSTDEVGVWLVQGISYDFSNWTMNVKANKFYPYYPWLE